MNEHLCRVIETKDEINELYFKNINTQRAQKIIDKINGLQKQLGHYRKVGNRWKIAGKAVRIINLTITSSIAGSLCVF